MATRKAPEWNPWNGVRLSRRSILATLVALTAIGIQAAATVENVVVRQQWPWNNKLHIDFVLSDPDGGTHDLNVVVRNGDAVVGIAANSLSGDLEAVAPGARRIVWDPTGVPGSVLADLTATVSVADDPGKFMILDISGGVDVASIPISFASQPPAGGWAADSANYTTKLVLRRIPAGAYTVGSPASEASRTERHEVLRQVSIGKDYYLALFPTTNKQYERIAGARPSGSNSSDYAPVYKVSLAMLRGANAHLVPADGGSWPKSNYDSFFSNLNERVSLGGDLAGYQFDVPSGAQWEIACRAGTTNTWYNGLDYDTSLPDFAVRLGEIARYSSNRTTSLQTVTSRQPNPWGFYDFIGNTREWVRDFFAVDAGVTDWRVSVGANDGVLRWTSNANQGCGYTRGGYEWCGAGDVRTAKWAYAGYGTPSGTGNDEREQGFRIACTYFAN